jgi:methylated-DNA-[protein]-cysteine S-methyltransferase
MAVLRFVPDLFGGITLVEGAGGLRGLNFGAMQGVFDTTPLLMEAERQLREYAEGLRFRFELEQEIVGTGFQLDVWRALGAIPYGETRSYRDIALAVNRPKGFQAIGQANTRNPLPIVIPCHRVINADGSMGGYGGGLDRKRELLALEQQYAYRFRETAA